MKKAIFKILAVLLLIAAVSGGGYYAYKKNITKTTATSSVRYSMGRVKKENLEVSVQATGTVAGVDAVNVFSFNTGIVEGMTVKQGAYVKQGDLFCKINDSNTAQAVDNARVTLEHSKLELQSLENQLDSLLIKCPIDGKVKSVFVAPGDDTSALKSTYGGMAILTTGANDIYEVPIAFPSSGKIAEVKISVGQAVKKGDVLFKLDDTNLKNSIETKKNEILQSENNLKNKEEDLAKSMISTPISGIVSVLNIKNGEIVDNSKLIATIVDTSKMQVTLPIDELDINKVEVGQNAVIKIDDVEGKTFAGKVDSISQSGTTTNNVTNYNVVVTIDNPEKVKVGMNANVTIAVQTKENVLTVPTEAIIDKNGKKYVMVSNSEQQASSGKRQSNTPAETKLVEVQTGIKNKTKVEILSGLKENQVVLTQLPTSSKSSNNSRSGMSGGMTGGGMSGGPGGF